MTKWMRKSASEKKTEIQFSIMSVRSFIKHIIRRKTRDIVQVVNTLNRLRHIGILMPAELL